MPDENHDKALAAKDDLISAQKNLIECLEGKMTTLFDFIKEVKTELELFNTASDDSGKHIIPEITQETLASLRKMYWDIENAQYSER